MPERQIISFLEQHLPWIYAFALSLWGAFVQYAERVRSGEPWQWRDLFLDTIICTFSGLLAFFICQSVDIQGWQQAVVVSLSAHQGTRAIGLISHFRDRFLKIGQ